MSIDLRNEHARFEEAFINLGWAPDRFTFSPSGRYMDPRTDTAFDGWLAAKRHAEQKGETK